MPVLTILRSLARLLLRQGISFGEFSEMARRAYVEVAFRDFTLPGRKPSIARVAVITGLHRKEVVRLSAPLSDSPESNETMNSNRAQRVVNAWLTDRRFRDKSGAPRELSLKNGKGSFHELVKDYSGDITGRAILDELIRQGVVEKTDQRTVRLNAQGFVPSSDNAEKVHFASVHVRDLLETIQHNLSCDPSEAHLQRQVAYHDMPVSVIAEYREFNRKKSEQLIRELNDWLSERKSQLPKNVREPCGRVGTGVYYFEENNERDGA